MPQGAAGAPESFFINGTEDSAVREGAFIHFKPEVARHKRLGLPVAEVEDVSAVRALQGEDVAKPLGGDQSKSCALPFQDRVDDECLAVEKLADLCRINLAELEHFLNAPAQVIQRRMSLGPRHLAGLFIDGDEVHKSTSNINGDS